MMQGLSRTTRRAMRRARRKRSTELNIVSMIDILTVLVFFLLVNATGVSVLGINLPDASPPSPTDKPPQSFSVILRRSGLTVADLNGPLQAFPNQAEAYDYAGVAHMLRQLKERFPGETHITLLLDSDVGYEALVSLMDAVRVQPTADGRGQRDLFPDITVGDAPPYQGVVQPVAQPATASPTTGPASPAPGAKP
jgi:biopolymer transport protein ExbD